MVSGTRWSVDGRVMDVLSCPAHGWDVANIVTEMGLSPHTVRNHGTNLRRKLDVRSRLEAVVVAVRMGVLTFDDERRGTGGY